MKLCWSKIGFLFFNNVVDFPIVSDTFVSLDIQSTLGIVQTFNGGQTDTLLSFNAMPPPHFFFNNFCVGLLIGLRSLNSFYSLVSIFILHLQGLIVKKGNSGGGVVVGGGRVPTKPNPARLNTPFGPFSFIYSSCFTLKLNKEF